MEEERFVLHGLGADPSSTHPAYIFFISPTLAKLLSYCHTASGLTFLISFIHYSSELEEKSESMKRNSRQFNSAKLRVNL